jgi:hypothetical protein
VSHREKRAAAVITTALIGIAVAAVAYLHPQGPSRPQVAISTPCCDRSLVTTDEVRYEFVSPSVGWAFVYLTNPPQSLVGHFWVFGTVDGAKHWQKQLEGQNGSGGPTPYSLQFQDKAHGFVFVRGWPDQLFRTADGGAHWNSANLPVPGIFEVTLKALTKPGQIRSRRMNRSGTGVRGL